MKKTVKIQNYVKEVASSPNLIEIAVAMAMSKMIDAQLAYQDFCGGCIDS